MIDLTPLEVRKKKGDFRRALRGYEPALVDDFLDIVADRLEQVVREHAALKDRVGGLERQVTEYRERERALTDALVTAQTMREEIRTKTAQEADQLKQRAEQDAGTRVQQAQQQSEVLLQQARREAETLVQRGRVEADAQLERAEQEAARLRTAAAEMRQRESDLLQELRDRQMQLLNSYRSFLERELNELRVMAESIQSGGDDLPPLAPAEVRSAALRAETVESAPRATGVIPPAAVDAAPPKQEAAPAARPAHVDLQSIIADATQGLATVGLNPETGDELPPFAPEPVDDGGAADDEAARLLENAERAGYHIELIEDDAAGGDELLLEESPPDEQPDDDWLSKMIRDDK